MNVRVKKRTVVNGGLVITRVVSGRGVILIVGSDGVVVRESSKMSMVISRVLNHGVVMMSVLIHKGCEG